MIITNIKYKIYNNYNNYITAQPCPNNIPFSKNTLKHDIFEKSTNQINFQGGVLFENNDFEKTFPRSFFKKLVQENLPCAYTGIRMIPRSDIDTLKHMQVLNRKSEAAMKYLKTYKDCLYDNSIEQRILTLLEKESKKNPELKLQELLKLKYDSAEKSLVSQQAKVLDSIILMSRNLPKADYIKIRKLAQVSFDKMLAQNPMPEDRFRRKDFIYALRDLNLSDEKMKEAMVHTAEKLPKSSNSINAFIVKYSQPYKFKYNQIGKLVKIPRDSEEIALRLLMPSVATDEHIYPKKLYRIEEAARQKGDKQAQELSDYKVTILTSAQINEIKEDMLIDDFIKKNNKFNVAENVQNHINKLIDIVEKWMNNGKIEDAKKLSEYIIVLKEEFERRSSIIRIDTQNLSEILPELNKKIEKHEEKTSQKRLKKCGRAANSHKETYLDHKGNPLENRKVQKHNSRFKK